LVAGILLAFQEKPQAVILIYGDRELSAQMASIHMRFMDRESAELCPARFDHGIELKPIGQFDDDDFRLIQSLLPGPWANDRRPVLVSLDGAPLELTGGTPDPFVHYHLGNLSAHALPFVFNDTQPLVLPFQAPASLLTFVRTFTRVIIVRPAGFACQSELENMIGRSGLSFDVVNASLAAGSECGSGCECLGDAKYHLEISELTPFL
jgi:hypothetical protein